MAARPSIDEFSQKIRELISAGPLADAERNMKALVSHAMAKMELVTREEFDAQSRVLARTLERLEALEARVAALEAAASGGDTPR